MNVSCSKCGKRYVLSDDKVAGKSTVKIRCKQCQSLISIDVASGAASVSEAGSAASSPSAIRSAGAVAMASMQQPVAAEGRSPWEDEATKAMPAMDLSVQWHAMIGGVQQGPFDVKALMGKVAAGEVTLRTYLWKSGMTDWKRASDLPEVMPLFAGGGGAAASARPPPRPSQPMARRDVAVANEMPSPEVTRPRGGNVADPLPSNQLDGDVLAQAQQRSPSSKVARPVAATPGANDGAVGAPLDDLFGDVPTSEPSEQPADLLSEAEVPSQLTEKSTSGAAAADPFAALGDAPDKELPPPGEATKFFIAQAGVNKRNPPWKIALFVVSLVGLPTAVLYLLSTFQVVQLPMVTRTTEDGREVQESFFSTGGVTGLKDLLTGDTKRRKAEAEQRERERRAAEEAARQRALAARNTGGPAAAATDEPVPTKAVNPQLAMNYADLDDPNKKLRGPRDRDATGPVIASSGLKDDVAAKVVADNLKAFNTCIENALRRNPNLKVGAVNVILTVGASGAVKSTSITPAQHQGTDWGACMMQAGKRIVFPASDGETEVQVPLKVGVAM
ncbi:MAG: zinc-ribbon domain-containing protein [Myxococcaceae bacterium]|nr:zinc-ribbon domain-containing protein [Myxococcaceae bacterium]